MNNRNVVMEQVAGDGAAAGGGAAAGANAGAQGGQQQQGQQQGGQQQQQAQPSVRDQFTQLLGDSKLIEGIPDDRVAALYPALKGKFDEFGKQFPADWRKLVAGDNADHLKTLDRFQSPKALYESYNTLRTKLSSGELKPVTAFPDKGTPEEQNTWRAANGVPEKADGYNFSLPKGVELSDDDKGVLANMQAAAHAKHVPAQHAQAFADWFLGEKQTRAQQRAENDVAYRESSEDAMRSEWGADYKGNRARIGALLDMGPKAIRETLGKARLADGSLLGDNPEWLRYFADISRQLIPQGVVLTEGADIGKSVDDEIASIEKMMKTNRKAYDKDEKAQVRLRELYTARDRLGKKAA